MIWNKYQKELSKYSLKNKFEIQKIPKYSEQNFHIFFIKLKNEKERKDIVDYLSSKGISASFHYIPLHSSIGGLKYGRFYGEDKYTTKESLKILRLPLFYNMKLIELELIIKFLKQYFI